METIGDRLRKVRQAQNLTVRGLRDLLVDADYPITPTSVSAYENDDHRIPAMYVVYFCDLFNVDVRWLLKGEGTQEDRPPTEAERVLAKIRELTQITPAQLTRLDGKDT